MAGMARTLLADGMRSASLWVMSGNAQAIGFYARLGGRVLTRRTVEYKGWELDETAYGWDRLETLL